MKSKIYQYTYFLYKCIIHCSKQETHYEVDIINDKRSQQPFNPMSLAKKIKSVDLRENNTNCISSAYKEPINNELPLDSYVLSDTNSTFHQSKDQISDTNYPFLQNVLDKSTDIKPQEYPNKKIKIFFGNSNCNTNKVYTAEQTSNLYFVKDEELKKIIFDNPFTNLLVTFLDNLIYYRYTLGKLLCLIKIKMTNGHKNKTDFSIKNYTNFTQQNFMEEYEKTNNDFISVGKLIEVAINEFKYNTRRKMQDTKYVADSGIFSKHNTNENFTAPKTKSMHQNDNNKQLDITHYQFLNDYFVVAYGQAFVTSKNYEGIIILLESLYDLSTFYNSNYKSTFQQYLKEPTTVRFNFIPKDYRNEEHFLFYWVSDWICSIFVTKEMVELLNTKEFPLIDFTPTSNSVYCILSLFSVLTHNPGNKTCFEAGKCVLSCWKYFISQFNMDNNDLNTSFLSTIKSYFLNLKDMHYYVNLYNSEGVQIPLTTANTKSADDLRTHILQFIYFTCEMANDSLKKAQKP